MASTQKPTTVDEYLSTFPDDIQEILQKVRTAIKKVMPTDAEEKISYGIPAFRANGTNVVYYSGWQHHISLYPVPHDDALQTVMAPYKKGKGTLQFSLDRPIPYEIIEKVAALLLQESTERRKKY